MSQLRLDPLTGRWVVVTAARGERPNAFLERSAPSTSGYERCPFCPGHESDTPPEITTLESGQDGVMETDHPWAARLIPNRYPAFTGHDAMAVENLGPLYMQAPASGSHEILVFSPEHNTCFNELSESHANALMRLIRDRVAVHAADSGLRYTQVVVNFGREAGASVEHPHAQLLGMPFVPRELMEEQGGFARFRGNCIMCATIDSEEWVDMRVVYSDDDVFVFCPFWSSTPYEMTIIPRHHEAHLNHATDKQVEGVSRGLQKALSALRTSVGDVAYNIVFHASPFRSPTDFHWHIHIYPKLTTPAGFEMGTGVPINVVAPETAASDLAGQSDPD